MTAEHRQSTRPPLPAGGQAIVRLLAVAVALTLVLAGIGAYFAARTYQQARDRAAADIAADATAAAATANRFLDDRLRLLAAIAASDTLRAGDRAAIHAYFARIDPPAAGFEGGMGWLDRDGQLQVNFAAPLDTPPVDLSDRDYVRAVLETRAPSVGAAVLGRAQPVPLLPLAVPTFDERGVLSGLLVATLRLDRLSPLTREQVTGAASVTIVDRAGQIVMDEGPISTLARVADAGRVQALRADGSGARVDVDGIAGEDDQLLGFASSPRGGWLVIVERDANAAFAPARSDLLWKLAILGGAATIGIAGAGWVARRIARAADDERAAVAALRASEERFRVALSTSQTVVATAGRDLRYTWIYNPHPDYRPEDALGRRDDELLPPEVAAPFIAFKQRVIDSGRPARGEFTFPLSDTLHTYQVIAEPLRDAAGATVGLTTAAVDISERIAAEGERERLLAEARASEARYRNLFAGVADAIFVFDATLRYIDANPAAEALYGFTREEFLTMRLGALEVEPVSAEEEARRLHALVEEGHLVEECDVRRADGSVMTVSASTNRIELPAGPIFVTVVRDVSARRAQERFQQELLANVSHELRTPITALKGFVELLQRRGEYNARRVEQIMEQARRLERLTSDLQDAARASEARLTLHPSAVDLGQLARASAERAALAAAAHAIRVEAPEAPVVAWCDGDRIGQVLDNLLSNAVKYSPDGGEIVVHVERGERDARVHVTDQGIGIPAAAIPRLFDRFYRVSEGRGSAQGLGLGLAITRALVEAHGGSIAVSSAPGAGSTFSITLPLPAGA